MSALSSQETHKIAEIFRRFSPAERKGALALAGLASTDRALFWHLMRQWEDGALSRREVLDEAMRVEERP